MALNWFKKRNSVMDLRKRGDSITIATNNPAPDAAQQATPAPTTQEQGSGFFNFWGNSDASSATPSPVADTTNFSSLSSTDSDKILRVERRIDDVADRLSRILDRIDLLEKKMDRVDRRGI